MYKVDIKLKYGYILATIEAESEKTAIDKAKKIYGKEVISVRVLGEGV